MTRRMAPVDAQTYWMSAKIPNDQFLLFVFDGTPDSLDEAVDELKVRARGCDELRLRLRDDSALRYPRWVRGEVEDGQFVVHDSDDVSWQVCLDEVARLADDQLGPRRMTWRVHVFTRVQAAPTVAGPATVVVVQVSHALGDGSRAAALAGALLGRAHPLPAVSAPAGGALLRRALRASRAHRQLVRDTEAGMLPPPGSPRPELSTNSRPTGARRISTLVRPRSQLPGPTVTVGVLVAVADALAGYLRDRGEDPATLGAEVPMAYPGIPHSHNNFRNVGVGLHPEVARAERAAIIADELGGHRRRGEHAAMTTASAAFAAVPAPLLRWGIGHFDGTVRSATVSGNTVVSSVNRGPADLRFGGRRVVFTAGYPALSPMMSLTHGVHGIGDVVAVSVHAADGSIDVDDYVGRLDEALRP